MSGQIEHVVVLMMENHSYDHMLGWHPVVGDLDPATDRNADGAGRLYPVTRGASCVFGPAPKHQLANVTRQVYGSPPAAEPTMGGFVADYLTKPDPGDAAALMGCYTADQLPALSALATSYTTFTRWFCSVPGPTTPNRLFANCASSGGFAGPEYLTGTLPCDLAGLPSVFGALDRAGRRWGVYFGESSFASELVLAEVQAHPEWQHGFTAFYADLTAGTLPDYAFLTPTLFPDSQHQPSDVRYGENLIADVYDALAASTYFDRTLLLVTYDEHGGQYDKVPPPAAPNPDGAVWTRDPPFGFDRLGPRVPAVLVSPYVAAATDATPYEHSSIAATVLEVFGLSWSGANTRLDTVATFSGLVGGVRRTDLPPSLPRPPLPPG